jgi:hypothetical protein
LLSLAGLAIHVYELRRKNVVALPGAKNLPSRPMMMPAMNTPMTSTGDPLSPVGTAVFGHCASTRPAADGSSPHREASHS